MNKNIFAQTLLENQNGVEKGSSKRVIAYAFTLVICFLCIYPMVKCDKDSIPLEAIGLLIMNLLILLGITAYTGQKNPPQQPTDKNTQA
jgi:hypothetical protein